MNYDSERPKSGGARRQTSRTSLNLGYIASPRHATSFAMAVSPTQFAVRTRQCWFYVPSELSFMELTEYTQRPIGRMRSDESLRLIEHGCEQCVVPLPSSRRTTHCYRYSSIHRRRSPLLTLNPSRIPGPRDPDHVQHPLSNLHPPYTGARRVRAAPVREQA